MRWADVYFNHGDTTTEIAVIAEHIGIVDNCYGDMGHEGYKGSDPHVTNIDCANTPGMPRVWGHSAIGAPADIGPWGTFIADRIFNR